MVGDETLSAVSPAAGELGPGVRAARRYRIVRSIGMGGMGEVFEAEDLVVGGRVALKALRADRVSTQAIDRLRRELVLARKVTHPNVCRIHDLGDHDGRVFITMELLDGVTLADRIREGALPLAEAQRIADALVAGLAAIHGVGIVHRDVKSANVVLANDRVVVTDLGLARSDAGDHTNLTGDAAVLGTAAYMAPEQVEGKPATAASDIYALGVVLFEMVTGTLPFRGESPLATASMRLTSEVPDPAIRRPDLPAAWANVIRRCMARAPADRFARVDDIADALREARPRRRRFVLAGAALAIAGAGVGIGHAVRGDGERAQPQVAAPAAQPSFQPLTFRRGTVATARFAPKGDAVIYSAAWDGEPEAVFAVQPGRPETRMLFGPGHELLAITPDERIALRTQSRQTIGLYRPVRFGTLAEASLTGAEPRELATEVSEADWLAGTWVSVHPRTIELGDRRITVAERATSLRASPSGDRVAVATLTNGMVSLVVYDREGRASVLVENWAEIDGIAWSPDGREIWFTGNRDAPGGMHALHAVDLQGARRELYRAPASMVLHDIARDGRVLLARELVTRDAAIRRPGVPQDTALSWFDYTLVYGISDAGDTIAFAELGPAAPRDGIGSIAFMRRLGKPAVKLIESGLLALSPDGAWVLAFDPASLDKAGVPTTAEANERLLLVPTGAGKPRALRQGPIRVYTNAAFSADGRQVVALGATARGGPMRLYIQDLDGEPRAVTPPGVWFGDTVQPLSVDGTLVFASGNIYPTAGGEPRAVPGLTDADVLTRWSADGRLFVQRRDGVTTTIFLVDTTRGTWERLYTIAPTDPAGVDIGPRVVLTPDGKTAAYSYRRRLSQLFVVTGLQ